MIKLNRLSPVVPVRIPIYQDEFEYVCKFLKENKNFEEVYTTEKKAEFLFDNGQEKAWLFVRQNRITISPYLRDFSEVVIHIVRSELRKIRKIMIEKSGERGVQVSPSPSVFREERTFVKNGEGSGSPANTDKR